MSAVIPSGQDVSTEEAAMQNLTTGFLLLPVIVAGIFLNALVVLLFWNWFVVPLGLKPLGYWHALGLSLFFSFIRGNIDKDIEKPRDAAGWKRRCKDGYAALAFFWVSGWLVHLVMGYVRH